MKKLTIFSLIFVTFDQIIKLLIKHVLLEYQYIEIVKGFFNITHVHNTGAAFSILSNNVPLLIGITLISLVLIYYYILRKSEMNKLNLLIYSLLMGGIIGNLLDRIFYGYVIDYLSVIIFNYHFPVFNLADMGIVISVFLLLFRTFKEEICKK